MSKEERIRKLTLLLKELFQYDNNDLDFGIYRIINIKRKEISEFIDKELFEIINEKIKTVDDNTELRKELEKLQDEIKKIFDCDVAEAKKKYAETPKVKDYIDKEKELKVSEKESDIEEEIYDNIISFFKRYYDNGDFISKRRYSKDNKYAIPYNGEEVYLYWANNDQYYIKTAENFTHYSFKAGSLKVNFEIVGEDVDVEKGNIKDTEKKFFIFHEADYDQTSNVVTVKFGYRGLTEDEEKTVSEFTDRKRLTKDQVNEYNLEKINEKIAIYGLSDLQKKHVKMDGEKSESSELKWHLNKYTTKNTSDYFIHKDLKKFLTQELDFYIKNELLHIDDIDTKENLDINLKLVKVFKEISLKIIEFLAQIEEFQKKLWEKKKFVISTDYCLTLDYIDEKYYPDIISNDKQLEEWKNLFSFDIESELKGYKATLSAHGKNEKELIIEVLKQNPTLTIDTALIKPEIKNRILSEIDNIEEKINGVLINSENYQALNLILNKYKNKIKCCYIDPPYNTEQDRNKGKFLYKDNFAHSTWSCLINDRLQICHELLKTKSVCFISIGDEEISNLKHVCEKIFGENNFVGIISRRKKRKGSFLSKNFNSLSEYIIAFSKNKNNLSLVDSLASDSESQPIIKRTNKMSTLFFKAGIVSSKLIDGKYDKGDYGEGTNTVKLLNPVEIENNKIITDFTIEGPFTWSQEHLDKELSKGTRVVINTKNFQPRVYKSEATPKPLVSMFDKKYNNKFETNEDALSILQNLFGYDKPFDYPKPPGLINYLFKSATFFKPQNGEFIIDFFAGSGTTGHGVMNLNKEDDGNRKYILVEMGDYFNTVLKPRMLKIIYSENWKNGIPQDKIGTKKQIIKYQKFEQYEDSINNIDFVKPSNLVNETKDYKLKYMLEFESKGSNTFVNIDSLNNPFEYTMKVQENNEVEDKNVDLIETFNYIYGIDVRTIQKKQNQETDYLIVKGTRKEKDIVVIWRNKSNDFSPDEDKKFIETEILTEDFDEIFTNGNSLVTGAKTVDEIFKTHMFR